MTAPVLLLASRRCSQCLATRNRIVSGKRAAGIIADCRATGTHFLCHKAADGEVVHCRGVHELLLRDWGGSTAYQLARRFGIEVREVDADALE